MRQKGLDYGTDFGKTTPWNSLWTNLRERGDER
jgi:hypothetical protein